jgi:hypothetical protein
VMLATWAPPSSSSTTLLPLVRAMASGSTT